MKNEVQLIDATPIKKFIQDGLNCNDPINAFGHDAIEILDEIEFAPTIDPESLRTKGRWEQRTDLIGFVRCSVCHDCNIYGDWQDGEKWRYCPNCGAKMEG